MLQFDEMDAALRNSLWNWFHAALEPRSRGRHDNHWRSAVKDLAVNFFKSPIDEVPDYESACEALVKKWFFSAEWFGVYNFVEYVLPRLRGYRSNCGDQSTTLNAVLAREMAGYRWVSGTLTPITSADELASVATASSAKTGFEGVATHMRTATALLGKRPVPDLRNSIKESMSAVESAVKLITGENSGGIDKALAIIEKRGELHPAFKGALSKLYGYTSDKDGVRHAILDQPTVTFGEAKFMLVACSAFVNLVLDAAAVRP